MLRARQKLLRDIINLLKNEEYVALKYIISDIDELATTSDLDLLVTPALVDKIYVFCQSHQQVAKIRTEQVYERTTIKLYLSDGGFLKLDLLHDLIWKNLQYFPVEQLIKHRIQIKGVWSCSPLHVFEHVLLYYILNKAEIPARYIQFFQQLPFEVNTVLLPYFNKKYGTQIRHFNELGVYKANNKAAICKYLLQSPQNNNLTRKRRYLKAGLAQLKRRIPQRGKIITFTGVDGVGKTTLLDEFEQTLSLQHGIKVVRLRHRPGLLPIISAWRYGKAAAEKRSMNTLPRQGANKSKWQSYLRFAYYYADYLVGQLWIKWKYCLRGYTVLYDRYYFDFIVDGKRSNITIDSSCPRWLYRFIMQPQLNFFLYADTHTILSRKQELKAADIEQLNQQYTQLFSSLKHQAVDDYHLIKNDNKQVSIQQILQRYNHQIA